MLPLNQYQIFQLLNLNNITKEAYLTMGLLRKYNIDNYRFSLVFFIVALSAIGILLIGSANPGYQKTQIMGLILGLVLMVIFSLLDYHFILFFYRIIYIVNVILLVLVQLVGKEVKGATRWLQITDSFQFQPSELAKILLILFSAQYIMEHEDDLNTWQILLRIVLLYAVPIFLILKQPDLSTSITIIFILCAIIYVGGLSYKIIGTFFAVAIPLGVGFLVLVEKIGDKILYAHQYKRIMAWIHPEEYINSEGYQQANSIIAIGSGQLTGKGLNNNVISSVKNGNYISEPQTDFIFSIAGEELGFIGSVLIVLLLGLIVYSCIKVAKNACDLAGRLIAIGMAAFVGFQGFVNIAVATGLIPNTGIPLPFVSYGLTSLVSLFIGMGIVLNVELQKKSVR